MDLHQNESNTTESIREAKAICNTAIQEAKAACACSIQEAEMHCSTAIKEAKATCPKHFAPWPSEMQRPSELPRMALFKIHMPSPCYTWKSKLLRRRTKVSSTSPCLPDSLQASPAELHNTLVTSYQVLMGQVPMSLRYNPS